jgi:hypothetical protein
MLIEPVIQRIRQRVLREKSSRVGILGDDTETTVYAGKSRFYVRFPAGTDSNGNTIYTSAIPIRYNPSSSVIEEVGVKVVIKIDYDGLESIKEMAVDWFDDTSIDSRSFNPASPYRVAAWVLLRNVVRGVCRAVGSVAGVASTLVTIREIPYFVSNALDRWVYTGTVEEADKVDLASYIPAVDTHRRVNVYFDTYLQEPVVTASTAQALTSGLDTTDDDECWEQVPHNEHSPLVAFELADNQSSVTNDDLIEDLRQFLNPPPVLGLENLQ